MGGHVGSKGRTSRGRGRQWADCDRLCLRNQQALLLFGLTSAPEAEQSVTWKKLLNPVSSRRLTCRFPLRTDAGHCGPKGSRGLQLLCNPVLNVSVRICGKSVLYETVMKLQATFSLLWRKSTTPVWEKTIPFTSNGISETFKLA